MKFPENSYAKLLVSWTDSDGSYTYFTMYNATFEEATQRAEEFGYKKPSWWQFWKPELPDIEVLNSNKTLSDVYL